MGSLIRQSKVKNRRLGDSVAVTLPPKKVLNQIRKIRLECFTVISESFYQIAVESCGDSYWGNVFIGPRNN
jgi:hypothetical protein